MPREALWCALKKFVVPELIIGIILKLHEGIKANALVSGVLSEEIDMEMA